jgi:hypothetical protein
LNYYDRDNKIELLLKKDEIPNTGDDDVATPLTNWGYGLAFTIYKNDPNFCTNCSIFVSLEGVEKTMLVINSYKYTNEREISLNEMAFDAILVNQSVVFKLNISENGVIPIEDVKIDYK